MLQYYFKSLSYKKIIRFFFGFGKKQGIKQGIFPLGTFARQSLWKTRSLLQSAARFLSRFRIPQTTHMIMSSLNAHKLFPNERSQMFRQGGLFQGLSVRLHGRILSCFNAAENGLVSSSENRLHVDPCSMNPACNAS